MIQENFCCRGDDVRSTASTYRSFHFTVLRKQAHENPLFGA